MDTRDEIRQLLQFLHNSSVHLRRRLPLRRPLDALPPLVHPFFFLGLADLDRRLLAPPPRVLGGDAGLELVLALRGNHR